MERVGIRGDVEDRSVLSPELGQDKTFLESDYQDRGASEGDGNPDPGPRDSIARQGHSGRAVAAALPDWANPLMGRLR